ncbi:hypothetical protein EMMF5_002625 [Cystobasidiomycetes sp. EMM_F5]
MAVQSGLFKLLLPLPGIAGTSLAKRAVAGKDDAVMFLLHPRQPLSYIASLISAEVSPRGKEPIEVSFHGAQESITQAKLESAPQTPQWAQATELGDFVQEAAQDSKFVIALHEEGQKPSITAIRVPTFEQRTQFLRARLGEVTTEIRSLLDIKSECDDLALKGAKRAAFGGFAGLVGYWGVVYWLTFHVYGWDLMEPVTYLTGLTGIMGGYLWFLYHQKEISYRSVFEMSSSKRREQLYDQKGFDRQRWKDLVDEGTELRRAIKKIAQDYATKWSMEAELDDVKASKEIKKHEKKDDDRRKRE